MKLAGGGDDFMQQQIVVQPSMPPQENGWLHPEYMVPVVVAIIGLIGAVWAAKRRA